MKLIKYPLWIVFAGLLAQHAAAQIYDTNSPVVQVLAGCGTSGYLNGNGTQAMFSNPSQIVADTSSNLFVLDSGNYRIRKISPDGTVSTFVGGGSGSVPGSGTGVSLNYYSMGSMAIDHQNTIWITCTMFGSGGLLRIASDASVNFLAYNGVSTASGVCVDSEDNLYYTTASSGRQVYRLAASGSLTLFAGSGSAGNTDGNGVFSSFASPLSLAADSADNVYVWDAGNGLIRRIDQNQNVTTIAGTGFRTDLDAAGMAASFGGISCIRVDAWGNVILACGSSIRKISAATNVTTIAGSFSQSAYANGAGALARFSGATGLCLSRGMIFVADSNNQMVRVITFNPQPELVTGPNLGIDTYTGLTITGLVGRTYQVQSSADISTWRTEATILLTASPYLWIDQNPVNARRFYRAFLMP